MMESEKQHTSPAALNEAEHLQNIGEDWIPTPNPATCDSNIHSVIINSPQKRTTTEPESLIRDWKLAPNVRPIIVIRRLVIRRPTSLVFSGEPLCPDLSNYSNFNNLAAQEQEESDVKGMRMVQEDTPELTRLEPEQPLLSTSSNTDCSSLPKSQAKLKIQNPSSTGQTYECINCLEPFSGLRRYQLHLQAQSCQAKYKCLECIQIFFTLEDLERHRTKNHSKQPNRREYPNSKSHKCPVCEKIVKNVTYFYIHLRTHTGEKPYKCSVCTKSFAGMRYLKSHMGVHAVEKPYECSVCPKKYAHMTTLKIHLKNHTGEKQYKCHICLVVFAHAKGLNLHLQIHDMKKRYKCPICPKSFTQAGNAKSHARLHSTERPYVCRLCTTTFKYASNLSAHMKIHKRITSDSVNI